MADAEELELYAVNDGLLYRTYRGPLERTLAVLKDQGRYVRSNALDRFALFASRAASQYVREFGGPRVAAKVVKQAADGMLRRFEDEYDAAHVSGRHVHKKTPAQLDSEIEAMLTGRLVR